MTESAYVSRINQIDAAQLDEEIYKILKIQTSEITKLCPQEKVQVWQPEIDAFLKFIIWCFSLGSGQSTFGQRLLDLNYKNLNRRKAALILIISVVPVYLRDKYTGRRRTSSSASDRRLANYVEIVSNVFDFLSFFNLLVFLQNGKQPSLVERILGVSSENSTKHRPRQIGYSYMTRELLWHGLIELFSVGLPMINFYSLKQTIVGLWTKKRPSENNKAQNPHMDLQTRCPYCEESPILPRYADCEHIYCYYCMKAHFTVMNTFPCLRCGVELHTENIRVYMPKHEPISINVVDKELDS